MIHTLPCLSWTSPNQCRKEGTFSPRDISSPLVYKYVKCYHACSSFSQMYCCLESHRSVIRLKTPREGRTIFSFFACPHCLTLYLMHSRLLINVDWLIDVLSDDHCIAFRISLVPVRFIELRISLEKFDLPDGLLYWNDSKRFWLS